MNDLEFQSSLKVIDVSKNFGSFQALRKVSMEFLPGEVHAVLGENGAGKSTLMNLIAGFLIPDHGEILWNQKQLPFGKPFEAKKLGIGMIHQHFTLVPKFSPRENLVLAKLERLSKKLNIRDDSQPSLDRAKELGWQIPDQKATAGLPVGDQQRIEILKSISSNERILIFDEPTAPLSKEEVSGLLGTIRSLAKEGRIVILIAHKLSEVMACADRVSVMRRGEVVGTMPISEATAEILTEMMIGEMPKVKPKLSSAKSSPGLQVAGLCVKSNWGDVAVRELSFGAMKGEIVGIGGVDGNGQIELSEALAGVRPKISGEIHFAGYQEMSEVQIAFIPGDRRREGLAIHMSIEDNMFIGGMKQNELVKNGILKPKKIKKWAKDLISSYDIRTESEEVIADSLSGGNQQKVVVSREFSRNPDLIVAVNPTRGLDVKATSFVYSKLLEARANGVAIVLISADMDELTELSDHIFFMSRGEKVDSIGGDSK